MIHLVPNCSLNESQMVSIQHMFESVRSKCAYYYSKHCKPCAHDQYPSSDTGILKCDHDN